MIMHQFDMLVYKMSVYEMSVNVMSVHKISLNDSAPIHVGIEGMSI